MEYQERTAKVIGCAYEVQFVNYLVATGKPAGLLLNFGENELEIKRKIKELS